MGRANGGVVSGGRYVGCVVFCLWCWIPDLWYVGNESYEVDICGASWSCVCVVVDGVACVRGEAEEPVF